MKRLLFGVVFALIGPFLHAQNGHYFLSHYKPENDNISYLSFDIQQDNNGILYFANRSGVLQFDGRTWTMVSINGAVYSLAVSKSGDVYAAGSFGFGRIGLDGKNQLNYLSLSDSIPKAKNIFASCATDSNVYFLTQENLIQYNLQSLRGRIVHSATQAQGALTGIFQINSRLYLGTENEGLKKIESTGVSPANIPQFRGTELLFSKRSLNNKTDFIATDNNKFYLQTDGRPLVKFEPRDSVYLTSNVVANCTWVTDELIAIGTLRGGVVFVDITNGATLEISNYYSGLPDNEVYAILTDAHQGVWVAHDYGFTRIAPFLPFRTFNHYPGLVGNLLCAQSTANRVYVGTTLGLFLLSKDEIYEDEVFTQTLTVKSAGKETKPERKKGIFRFSLKKKKNVEPTPVPKKPAAKSKKIQVQKTRKVLKGIEYSYKRVEGVVGKVDQFLVVGNKLLCGGVGGVFEIEGSSATPITREPIRTIFYSKHLKQLLVSTYGDEIKSFRSYEKNWLQGEFPDTLSIYVDYIFEDNLQDLWLCGHDQAVKVGTEDGEILDAEAVPLPHSSIDRTVGMAYGQEVYLTQNGEFFHYASFKNTFVKYDSLPGPKKYFASAGYFWFYDGHKWRTINQKLQGALKTEWLALFPDIRFLAPAEQGKSLWVITASNELYKFSSDQIVSDTKANPLFLKEVRGQQVKHSPRTELQVDERESALTFEFIQPEYVSLQAVEYRHWVQDLQPKWSEWSTMNNVINFPFLPPGKYKVLVQSKDLFGKITEIKNIDLNVLPPYWKRPWFYALEFLFFGSLVVFSLRLKSSNIQYRWISRFLSALTVIMLIQFVQTIVNANISLESTPVADFFIQVFIALLVLPVEEFLRRRISKADERAG